MALKLALVDDCGQPLNARVHELLGTLLERFDRQFPQLAAEPTCREEIFELAARKIARREIRGGPINNLHGYAWVTLRSVAISRWRLGSVRLVRHALTHVENGKTLAQLPSNVGTPEQIESAILLAQVTRWLTSEEREVFKLKM